jgi:hypothetical protein
MKLRAHTFLMACLLALISGTSAVASGGSGKGSSGSGKGGTETTKERERKEEGAPTTAEPPTSAPTSRAPSTSVAPRASSSAPASSVPASNAPTSSAPPSVPATGPKVTVPSNDAPPSIAGTPSPPAPVATPNSTQPGLVTSIEVVREDDDKKQQFTLSNSCGRQVLVVEFKVDEREIRVRTRVPKSKATWSAVIVQDRKIAWKGSAGRGEMDRRLTNLPGTEMISVRLSDRNGTVCALQATITA